MASVRLLGIPAETFVRLQRWVDDLLRELEIIEVGDTTGTALVPADVRDVIRSVLSHYEDARASAREQAAAAAASGWAVLDVELDLPVEAADAAVELAELFDHVDELARRGVLLTTAPPPELVALRRWTAAEVRRQLREGAPPSRYPG